MYKNVTKDRKNHLTSQTYCCYQKGWSPILPGKDVKFHFWSVWFVRTRTLSETLSVLNHKKKNKQMLENDMSHICVRDVWQYKLMDLTKTIFYLQLRFRNQHITFRKYVCKKCCLFNLMILIKIFTSSEYDTFYFVRKIIVNSYMQLYRTDWTEIDTPRLSIGRKLQQLKLTGLKSTRLVYRLVQKKPVIRYLSCKDYNK